MQFGVHVFPTETSIQPDELARDDWRPGDQWVFYADMRNAKRELGWEPKIDLEKGMELLFEWVKANTDQFQMFC